MALPVILIAGAAIAGTTGVANAAVGAKKLADTNEEKKEVEKQHHENIANYEVRFSVATQAMDTLGESEIRILSEFEDFSDVIEKIENRPEFGEIIQDGFELPAYDMKEIKDVAVGAMTVAGGIGGVAAGTFGGFAAAGATTSAVMALGTASTGTAIASLSGAAATNATLAALGGGALAAGGGGIALGTTVLGAATLGVGLMVGGVIFNITGSTMKAKVGEAREAVETETEEVNKVCLYLEELANVANNYHEAISVVKKIYDKHFARLQYTVLIDGKTDYHDFSETDKIAYSNTVLLVGILYDMLKVHLVSKVDDEHNEVNVDAIGMAMKNSMSFLDKDPLTSERMKETLKKDVTEPVIDFSVYDEEPEEEEKPTLKDQISKGFSDTQTKVSEGLGKVTPQIKQGAENATKAASNAFGAAKAGFGAFADAMKKGKAEMSDQNQEQNPDTTP